MKPERRRPQSGKAQIKNNINNIIRAMPSARATAGSLHSVAYGEPSPAYPYRGFEFILNYFLGDDF